MFRWVDYYSRLLKANRILASSLLSARCNAWAVLVAIVIVNFHWPSASAQPSQPPAPLQTKPFAQPTAKPETVPPGAKSESDALEAFNRGDYTLSRRLLEQQAKREPTNFVPRYNLACCCAKMGDTDACITWLLDAIEKGFCDAYILQRDDAFDAVRRDERFKAIISGWQDILIARRDANLEQAKLLFKEGSYEAWLDTDLRLAYWSAFEKTAFVQAREEVTRMARFADTHVFGPASASKSPTSATSSTSPATPPPVPRARADDAWVVVVLPSRKDYMRWAVRTYGADVILGGTSSIGGAYEHDAKRLVSMDLGPTLRHEFFHVLHWRDNTQRGQLHPIWIQEGLCSLMEDYDLDETGSPSPAPSWRTNISKRLEALRRLMPVRTLVTLPPLKFSGQRPLANYAAARSLFMFLEDQGKLTQWYQHYVDHYEQDRSGLTSLLEVVGGNADELDSKFRTWLRALPAVRETLKLGDPSLGVEVEAGHGEGPVVTAVQRANKGGLRKGDIITGINGRACRDVAELVRILTSMRVGDIAEVEYRRVRILGTATITLSARK